MISLPWPSSALSPNARGHWSIVAAAKRAARNQAGWLAKAAYGNAFKGADAVTVSVTFHAPTNHRRDTDNLIASMKAALDGVADGIGVDDSKFALRFHRGEVRKGGCVIVEVSA